MKKRQLISSLAAVMAASLVLAGCSSGKASKKHFKKQDVASHVVSITKATKPSALPASAKNRKDTVVIAIDTDVTGNFNPLFESDSNTVTVMGLIYENMFNTDKEGNLIPNTVSWTVSKDHLTYTFKINDKDKFSDGTPVTASDLEFTYEVACDKSFDGPYDFSNTGITGYNDFHSGKATSISGIKVVDDHTLTVTLDKVNANALFDLNLPILSKNYYGKKYKPGNDSSVKANNKQPMGDGSYKFSKFKPGQEVDLVSNDNYWQGAPKIKNAIFKVVPENTEIQALQTGDVDIEDVTPASADIFNQVKALGFYDLQTYATNIYSYIGFNCKDPKFSDKRVRQALTYGFDREQFAKVANQGYAEVLSEPQTRVSWNFNPDVNNYAYNPDKANKLLDEAGWKKGSDGIREKDGVKLDIHMLGVLPSKALDIMVPMIKKNYQQIGIKFTLDSIDWNAELEKVNAKKAACYTMSWMLTPDPDNSTIFSTNGSQNTMNYSNPKVDELYKEAQTELDKSKQKVMYQKIWKLLNEDMPYVFLKQPKEIDAVSSRIKGIELSPYIGITTQLWKAEIK